MGSNPFCRQNIDEELQSLLNLFQGKAVPTSPIWAFRAGLALWIIDAFLVRASENAIRDHYRACLMLAKKARDLFADDGIAPNVSSIGEPAFKQIRLVAFIRIIATAIFVARSAVGP